MFWSNIIAACKDSYVIYARGFDWVGRWLGFTESIRISIIRMIIWLCTFEEVRPYCFYVVLGDSQWFSNDSWVIPGDSWVILGDSQAILKDILMILEWFLVILEWFSNDS